MLCDGIAVDDCWYVSGNGIVRRLGRMVSGSLCNGQAAGRCAGGGSDFSLVWR